MKKIRGLNTLTTEEIIGMVDVLLPHSRLNNPPLTIGSNRYRKIEAQMDKGDGIWIRVAYSDLPESEKNVTAFWIDDKIDDVMLTPVSSAIFSEAFVESLGLTLDYSTFDQHLRKTYTYFAERLQLWNFDRVFRVNHELSEDWCTVDEITIESPSYITK